MVSNEIVTVRGEPVFQNHLGKIFKIVMQRFNDINRLQFFTDTVIRDEDLSGNFILQKGDIIASTATVHERSIGSIFQITCRLLEQ